MVGLSHSREGVIVRACAILQFTCMFVAQGTAFAAPVAGFTPAKLDVSLSGAATYAIPIAAPQGIAGLQPQLTLQYNSQDGRGIAGPGWSLQGVSSIKRCQQLPLRDAPASLAITLTATDRFCVDGTRIVLDGTGKSYGADGAVYRQVFDNFSRVTSRGTAGTGPASFLIESKTGLKTEFGNTADSQVIPGPALVTDAQPTTVVMWSANKVSDRYGNAITYTYTADKSNGSQLLSQITYNGGAAYIKLVYDADPNPRTYYLAGTKLTNPKLLTDVSTYVLDDNGVEKLVKHYSLGYDKSDAKGGSDAHPIARLVRFSECGSDGTCLGDITFDWAVWAAADAKLAGSSRAGTSQALVSAGGSAGITDDRLNPRVFADLNGDGKPDVVAFKNDGVYALFSSSATGDSTYALNPTRVTTEFESGSAWKDQSAFQDLFPRHLVDMNNDGYPDIVGFHPDRFTNPSLGAGIYLSLWDVASKTYQKATLASTSASTFLSTSGWGVCYSLPDDALAPRYLVDMNNDGRPDILGINQSGIYVSYSYVDSGGNIKFPDAATLISDKIRMEYRGGSFSLQNYLYDGCDMAIPRQPIYPADMNGDGYPDLVAVTAHGVYVLLWDPTLAVPTFQGAIGPYTGIKVPLSNTKLTWPTYLYDMNGDGYPDLVQFSSSGVTVALWSGKTFLPASPWTSEFSTSTEGDFSKNPHRVADMNGDGYPDIVDFRNDGIWVGLSDGQGKIYPATHWSTEFKAQTKDVSGNTWGVEYNTPRAIIDVNGDGIPDVWGFGDQQVRWASVAAPAGTRITHVTDARGSSDYVQYSVALDHSGFYKTDAGTPGWPVYNARSPLLVVSQLSASDGIGGYHNVRYRYGGRKTSAIDGSLGFSWMGVWDELTNVDALTSYQQGYPLIGRPSVEELHRNALLSGDFPLTDCTVGAKALCMRTFTVGSGQTFKSTIHNWTDQSLASAGEFPSLMRKFVFEASTREQAWELDGTTLPLKQESFSYDEPLLVSGRKQFGNLTQHAAWYADGTKTTVDNKYEAPDETAWKLGRLSTSTVTSVVPARSVSIGTPADAPQTPDKAAPYTPTPHVSIGALLSIINAILLSD